jgi:nucleoside-diphosphate-sugar epimerase
VVSAFVLVLGAPREAVHNQVFNVGVPGDNFRVRDLARIVSEAVPGSEVVRVAHAGGDTRDYRVSFDKLARTFPGFSPGWTVPAGAAQVRDALARGSVTLADVEGPRFTRLARLRQMIERGDVDAHLRMQSAAVKVA